MRQDFLCVGIAACRSGFLKPFAVGTGLKPGRVLEYLVKMLGVVKADALSDGADRDIGRDQKPLRLLNAVVQQIFHKGRSEFLFE